MPNGISLSRKDIDDLTDLVKNFGAKGLAYFKCENVNDLDAGIISPIKKFLDEDVIKNILNHVNATDGDLIFFSADQKDIVNDSMAALIKKAWSSIKSYRGQLEIFVGFRLSFI